MRYVLVAWGLFICLPYDRFYPFPLPPAPHTPQATTNLFSVSVRLILARLVVFYIPHVRVHMVFVFPCRTYFT